MNPRTSAFVHTTDASSLCARKRSPRRTVTSIALLFTFAVAIWGCEDRPDPVTSGPLFQFSKDQNVVTTTDVGVRSGPSNFSSVVVSKPIGTAGTILASPGTLDATGDNTIYWQVAFGGTTGWVSGVFLMPGSSGGGSVACNHHVTPGGVSSGDGNVNAPWNLQHALSGGAGQVAGGDTVCIHAGVYTAGGNGTGKFNVPSTLKGTGTSRIVFRRYPGERAILEDPGTDTVTSQLKVAGQYLVFWGLEFRNTKTNRADNRNNVVWNTSTGSHNKYINLVIYDGGVGFLTETSTDVEITGSVMYNNGRQGYGSGERGHGHGIYVKNNSLTDRVLVRDNVLFDQFGFGVHAFSNPGTKLNNITILGNVAFNNGTVADNTVTTSGSSNILMGGDDTGTGDVVDSNMTFFSDNPTGTWLMSHNVKLGYFGQIDGTIEFKDNYIVGHGRTSEAVLKIQDWSSGSSFTGNQIIACTLKTSPVTPVCGGTVVHDSDATRTGITWSGNTHIHDVLSSGWKLLTTPQDFATFRNAMNATNETGTTTAPATTKVFVRKNPYETGRAIIVVYNWGNVGQVNVDLTGIVPAGAQYRINNVFDLFNTTGVASGIYPGSGTVPLSITTVPVPPPLGWSVQQAPSTGTAFNVYIVQIAPY